MKVDKLLYVEWIDPVGPHDEWTKISKVIKSGTALIRSVGFVARDDEKVLVLIPHVNDEQKDCFGDITIPKGCIKKRRVLKCPT